jgi:hypothetical protein
VERRWLRSALPAPRSPPDAQVAKQLSDRPAKGFGSAVVALPSRAGTRNPVVIDVIDHHQVQPAVAVVIDETSRGTPEQRIQARLLGNVGKRAVAVVQEQPRPAELGDEHVGPPVVVDVADGHAHAVAGDVQAGTRADVGEPAIRCLPEQPVGRTRIGAAVLNQIDIQAPVVVEIEEGTARTDDLRHEIATHGAGVMDEVQSGFRGDVNEPGRRIGFGGGGGRVDLARPLAARHKTHEETDAAEQSGERKAQSAVRIALRALRFALFGFLDDSGRHGSPQRAPRSALRALRIP